MTDSYRLRNAEELIKQYRDLIYEISARIKQDELPKLQLPNAEEKNFAKVLANVALVIKRLEKYLEHIVFVWKKNPQVLLKEKLTRLKTLNGELAVVNKLLMEQAKCASISKNSQITYNSQIGQNGQSVRRLFAGIYKDMPPEQVVGKRVEVISKSIKYDLMPSNLNLVILPADDNALSTFVGELRGNLVQATAAETNSYVYRLFSLFGAKRCSQSPEVENLINYLRDNFDEQGNFVRTLNPKLIHSINIEIKIKLELILNNSATASGNDSIGKICQQALEQLSDNLNKEANSAVSNRLN